MITKLSRNQNNTTDRLIAGTVHAVRIGSYNLDPRSAYLDTESMLAIDSPEFTEHFKQVQDAYFRQSLEVSKHCKYENETGTDVRPVSIFKWGMVSALYLPVSCYERSYNR